MLSLVTTFHPTRFDGLIVKNALRGLLAQKAISRLIVVGPDGNDFRDIQGDERVHFIRHDGLPTVTELMRTLDEQSTTEIVGYVNSDIVFLSALEQVLSEIRSFVGEKDFLATGWRYNIPKPTSLIQGSVSDHLRREHGGGTLHHGGLDYFIFRRGMFLDFPAAYVGRALWDYEFIRLAMTRNAVMIDVTEAAHACHFDHVTISLTSNYHQYYFTEPFKHNRRHIKWYKVIAYPVVRTPFLMDRSLRILQRPALSRISWVSAYILGFVYYTLLLSYPFSKPLLFVGGRAYRFIFNKWFNRA